MSKVFRFEEYVGTDQDIRIVITPDFLAEKSNPDEGVYSFSYNVNIENQTSTTIQLLNRHWKIYENEKQVQDVKGEGVVGLQPVLEPREVFQYASWVLINHPVGKMTGTYTFQDKSQNFFDVQIPAFDLIYADPQHLH